MPVSTTPCAPSAVAPIAAPEWGEATGSWSVLRALRVSGAHQAMANPPGARQLGLLW
ncbi:hypothetical protein BN12_30024 [Nostocoides japonicum T1-X7]|uniref:Uncharacterized protein n=1 Tax=Nostocoides japonicum T1-X7 TaxID=1194083 RepID=A0A077LX61_9MICO|nr:hypothetical protein BN12_30024 [Tetrasphaera japonica T1-X7]